MWDTGKMRWSFRHLRLPWCLQNVIFISLFIIRQWHLWHWRDCISWSGLSMTKSPGCSFLHRHFSCWRLSAKYLPSCNLLCLSFFFMIFTGKKMWHILYARCYGAWWVFWVVLRQGFFSCIKHAGSALIFRWLQICFSMQEIQMTDIQSVTWLWSISKEPCVESYCLPCCMSFILWQKKWKALHRLSDMVWLQWQFFCWQVRFSGQIRSQDYRCCIACLEITWTQ